MWRGNIPAEVTAAETAVEEELEKTRKGKQHGVVSPGCLVRHLGADISDSVASGAQTQKNGDFDIEKPAGGQPQH